MFRKLYDWVMNLARSRHAPASLAAVSFAESSFFPIPPDVMLAPMVLAQPNKAWRYAAVCTIASVLGGGLGYLIGYYLTGLGQQILSLTGNASGMEQYQCWYAHWGLWVILIKGLTPIPYKLVTIASGIAHYAFGMFVVLSVITRGARFFLTAVILKRFGPRMLEIVEKRLLSVTLGLVGLIVLGLLMARYGHAVADLFS